MFCHQVRRTQSKLCLQDWQRSLAYRHVAPLTRIAVLGRDNGERQSHVSAPFSLAASLSTSTATSSSPNTMPVSSYIFSTSPRMPYVCAQAGMERRNACYEGGWFGFGLDDEVFRQTWMGLGPCERPSTLTMDSVN